MTITILFFGLLFLAVVLVLLMAGMLRELRKRSGSAPKKAAPAAKPSREKRSAPPAPAPAPERTSSGRTRTIKPQSDGGGDPSARQNLMQSGRYAACEQKLEQAFELYSQNRISLDTYDIMVRAEAEAAKRLRAELRAMELADRSRAEIDRMREDIETIEVAVRWCQDWSAGLRKLNQG